MAEVSFSHQTDILLMFGIVKAVCYLITKISFMFPAIRSK